MTSTRPRATISAVLIVKDEEAVLDESLAALAWVDEVVVYDTGSTDRTREIAAARTDVVVEGYWDDDFGAARNRAIDHATGDWVLVVDADEVVTGDTAGLRKQVDGAAAAGLDRFVIPVRNGEGDARQGGEVVNIRLFRRDCYHYAGRLHEQVVPRPRPARPLGAPGTVRNVRLLHSGYTAAAMAKHRKSERNLAIAERDLAEAVSADAEPAALAALRANLARSLASADRRREALELGGELRAEGLVPRGSMALLAQAMVGSCALLDEPDELDRWLDTWEAVDYSPVWARATRVRVLAGRDQPREALALLEQIPTTLVDESGRRFVKHELAGIHVAVLVAEGRLADATRVAVDAAAAGFVSLSPDELVLLFTTAGRPVETLVTALHERIWRQYAVWAAADATAGAVQFLHAMLAARPGDLAVLLCAAGAAESFGLEDLAVWSAELRRAGLAEMCPLVPASTDPARDVRTRVLAAAMAVGIFDDARAVPALEAALGEVGPEQEAALLAELDVLVPGLVAAA